MVRWGSDAAIEAADVALMDDDPAKITLAMRIARRTLSIVHQNIVFAWVSRRSAWCGGGHRRDVDCHFCRCGVTVLAVLNACGTVYKGFLTKSKGAAPAASAPAGAFLLKIGKKLDLLENT